MALVFRPTLHYRRRMRGVTRWHFVVVSTSTASTEEMSPTKAAVISFCTLQQHRRGDCQNGVTIILSDFSQIRFPVNGIKPKIGFG